MTPLEEYQVQQQLTNLLNQYKQQSIYNSFQQSDAVINRGQALSDLRRQFERRRPLLGVPYSRRGLETSGIRSQGIDRSLADQQQRRDRMAEGFDRSISRMDTVNLENSAATGRGIQDVQSYRQAYQAQVASQLRGL